MATNNAGHHWFLFGMIKLLPMIDRQVSGDISSQGNKIDFQKLDFYCNLTKNEDLEHRFFKLNDLIFHLLQKFIELAKQLTSEKKSIAWTFVVKQNEDIISNIFLQIFNIIKKNLRVVFRGNELGNF